MASPDDEKCELERSQIVEDFFATRSLIGRALDAENILDNKEALIQYQQAIGRLQKALGRKINSRCRKEKSKTLSMMKQALEACRTRVTILDNNVVDFAKHYYMKSENLQSNVGSVSKVIFEIPGGVQLFSLLANGEMTALSGNPTPLQIMLQRLPDDEPGLVSTLCYVRVGSWGYLLDPNAIVVKRVTNIYEFPAKYENEHVPTDCESFGIVLSSDLHQQYIINFENILEDACDFSIEEDCGETPVIDYSKTVGYVEVAAQSAQQTGEQQTKKKENENNINSTSYDDNESAKSSGNSKSGKSTTLQTTQDIFTAGTDLVCDGISLGAKLTSSLILRSSKSLQKIIPVASKPVEVNEYVERGCEVLWSASDKGLMVTNSVVGACSKLTDQASKTIAPLVTAVAGSSTVNDLNESLAGQVVKEVLSVTQAGVQGISRVWAGLEDASLEIQKAASDATVDTIHHRYGEEAANVATHVTEAAMNFGRVRSNYKRMNIKKIARDLAQETGRDYLQSYIDTQLSSSVSVNIQQ